MRIANRAGRRAAIAAVASGALAVGAFTVMSASASQHGAADTHGMMGAHVVSARTAYSFRTVDNAADLTFNQLLGINNEGVIAGYFGSGAQGHPNMGYLLTPGGYRSENFPGSVQTQVTGLNDNGVTVGFWSGMNTANQANDNSGFYATGGQGFRSVSFPVTDNASPPVNQLLGVNDHGDVAGFYTDSKGNTDGFTATPALASVAHLHLQAMPAGTVTFVWVNGQLTLQVNAFGFTPGSSHVVELVSPQGATWPSSAR